jgi:hypothetical protein
VKKINRHGFVFIVVTLALALRVEGNGAKRPQYGFYPFSSLSPTLTHIHTQNTNTNI